MIARARAGLRAFAGQGLSPWRVAVTVGLSLAGACAFLWLGMPLPWVLGPMTFGIAASLIGVPLQLPMQIRPAAIAIVGVLLGARFTPDTIAQAAAWWPSLVGVALYVVVCGTLSVLYLRRVAGLDQTTAYFAGMPGGLVEMVLQTEHYRGDVRTVAMIHSVRIVIIVFLMPVVVQIATGEALGRRSLGGTSWADTTLLSWLWLAATATAGALAARALRLPAPFLLGPFLVSGVVHIFGWTEFKPASEVVAAAQLIIGTILGVRFVGVSPRELGRAVGQAIGTVLILVLFSFVFAFALQRITGHDFVSLFLSLSAGGLTESSLIALAVHADVAFIAAHHVLRLLLVTAFAALVFRLIRGRQRGADPAAEP